MSLQFNQLDLQWVRSQFPALSDDYILMDNAGGSQACQQVINRIPEYFKKYNVQLGASYKHSSEAGQQFKYVHEQLALMINASDPREVITGPSTTALIRIMSICLARNWNEGDEVIVTNSDHEANVSPWMDLQEQGIKVKIWKLNPESLRFDIDDLKKLITDKTKLVAMVHCSNILGTINPIKDIGKVVHNADALFCVDGVAYAPHGMIDVKDWDVDFYTFSTYKTYGPHQSIMYARYNIIENLRGLNHYFIQDSPYKFQPGNFNFELTYSLLGIKQYLEHISALHYNYHEKDRDSLKMAFNSIAHQEQQLNIRLLDYLNAKSKVRIIGESKADRNMRVPTISFVHQDFKSSEIVDKTDPHRIGIRFGDFYAKKLIHDLGLEAKDGVVRVSMVHYNTVEQVDILIKVFDKIGI